MFGVGSFIALCCATKWVNLNNRWPDRTVFNPQMPELRNIRHELFEP